MPQNSAQLTSQATRKYYTDAEIIDALTTLLPEQDVPAIVTFLASMAGDLSSHVLQFEISGISIFNDLIILGDITLLSTLIQKTSRQTLSQAFCQQNSSGITSMDIVCGIHYDAPHINLLLLSSISNAALNVAISQSRILTQSPEKHPFYLLLLDDLSLCKILDKLDAQNMKLLSQPITFMATNWECNIFHLAIKEKKSAAVIAALIKKFNTDDLYQMMFQGSVRANNVNTLLSPLMEAITENTNPTDVSYDDNKTGMYVLEHLPISILAKLIAQMLATKRLRTHQGNTSATESVLEWLARDNPGLYNYILRRLRIDGTVTDFNAAVVDLHRLDMGICNLLKMALDLTTFTFSQMQNNTIILSSTDNQLYYANPTHKTIWKIGRNHTNHSHYDHLKALIIKMDKTFKVVHDSKTLQLITLLTGVSPIGNAEYLYATSYDFTPPDLSYGFISGCYCNNNPSNSKISKKDSIYEATCTIAANERKQLKTAYECMRKQDPLFPSMPADLAILILQYIASLPAQIERAVANPVHTQHRTDLVTMYFLLAQAVKNFDRNTKEEEKLVLGTTVLSYLASNQGIEKIIKPVIEHRVEENNKISVKIKSKFASWFSFTQPASVVAASFTKPQHALDYLNCGSP